MRRHFNTEGTCDPEKHYMVRLDERLARMKQRYIDRGSYFVINRGWQYGKTTTQQALAEYLKEDYIVLSMDFQKIGLKEFQNENNFSRAFARMFVAAFQDTEIENKAELTGPIVSLAKQEKSVTLSALFAQLSIFCGKAPKPVVLMIDEADIDVCDAYTVNDQVFLDFLGLLRGYYLDCSNTPTFQSVILTGVYDIRNLKLKLRPEPEYRYNSPWNIAAGFDVEMGFSAGQIAEMLTEYEADNQTGMDISAVAEEIYQYTSGYPYLVSFICKALDEELPKTDLFSDGKSAWSREGISEAAEILLEKSNVPLFDSMARQMEIYPELRDMIEIMICRGRRISYCPDIKSIRLGTMFGLLKEQDGQTVIANRIFEMFLQNMLITEETVV